MRETDRALLLEAVRLADSIVVRSWCEYRRMIDAVGGGKRRDFDIVVNADPDIPATVAAERTDVVVYAPHYRADELALFVTALGDLEVPVTIVARDPPSIAGRVRFDAPAAAAEALGRARVIVDADSNDPGVALALASSAGRWSFRRSAARPRCCAVCNPTIRGTGAAFWRRR